MHLCNVLFSAPCGCNFTTANESPRHISTPNRFDALLRAHIMPSCHWRALLLLLASCCLPIILSGCGGKLDGVSGTGTGATTTNTTTLSSLSCANGTITGAGT